MGLLGSRITVILCVCVALGLYHESSDMTSFTRTKGTTVFKWRENNLDRHELHARQLAMPLVEPRTAFARTKVLASEGSTHKFNQQSIFRDHPPDAGSVPSYARLCNALLYRKDHHENAAPLTVEESEEVCLSSDSFSSMVTIMISTLVASAGTTLGISYEHKCATPLDLSTATIQQLLPGKLYLNKIGNSFDIVQQCEACHGQAGADMVECFGFPVLGRTSNPEIAAELIPHFRQNIEAAVTKTRQLENVDRSVAHTGVTIYLDAETEVGADVYQVPMKHYAEIIPRDIASISLVVSERCLKCRDLSILTNDYLHQMYPTAEITLEFIGGSALAYERVMDAAYYICSPSTFCLLPSLFKKISHSSYLIPHPGVYPWFTQLAQNSENQWKISIFFRFNLPVHRVGGSVEAMHSFLFQPEADPTGQICLKLRGRIGGWEQDMDYARSAQYVKDLYQFSEFDIEPTPEMPYRLATTFRWTDGICPLQLVKREGFCRLMQNLGLTRIYFVGDSLTMQMVRSLWKLLGHEDDAYFMNKNITYHRYEFNRTVECPNHQHRFEIVYTRNDMIDDNDDIDLAKRTGDTDYNCGETEFCMPWIRSFAEYQGGGTLLIANVGPHIHKVDVYRKLVDDFLVLMDLHQKSNDLVMFRTTPPGHNNCQSPDVAPLQSYDEYKEKHFIADAKSYQLFPFYNRFVEQSIRKRHRDNLQVLDVVPMTVLRPDGHISGPQKCKACTKTNDCLHYILPGPPDFWNHLMYSNLITMEAAKKSKQFSNGGSRPVSIERGFAGGLKSAS